MVPLRIKLSFAAGGIALNLVNLSISQWLLKLYLPDKNSALVGSSVFLAAFFIGRVVDGVMDPLVGNWSDNSRSRFGRRMPFIAAALPAVVAVTTLIWMPPDPSGFSSGNSLFVFILIQLFFIFWTLLANPFMALLPELTADRSERITISTMLAVCYMIGTILFAFTGSVINTAGYRGLGILLGASALLSFLPSLLFIREKNPGGIPEKASATAGRTNLVKGLREALSEKAFVVLLTSTSLFWFALNCVTVIIPFWIEAAAGGDEGDVPLVMAPFILANIIFFFLFGSVSRRKGKYPAFIVTLGGAAAAMFIFTLQGSIGTSVSPMLQAQICMGLIGIFVAGFLMLPNALLADVIDNDERISGKRREGLFFGIQSVFQKVTIGLSVSVSSVLMYAGGSDTATVFGLKLVAAAAGTAAAAACIIFIRFPLRDV